MWVSNCTDDDSLLITTLLAYLLLVPAGPVFDKVFHDFLVNSIAVNNIPTFAAQTLVLPFVNTATFKRIYPNWFLTDLNTASPTLPPFLPEDLNYLDTDITLAFPPLSPAAHPDYSVHTQQFARNNIP